MANDQETSKTSHRTNPGWKHCHLMDESNLNTIVCNYCGKVMKVGVTTAKEYLMAKKANQNVRGELWKLFKEKIVVKAIGCCPERHFRSIGHLRNQLPTCSDTNLR